MGANCRGKSDREDAASRCGLDGLYLVNVCRLMRSLFLDLLSDLAHAETMGALAAGRGSDLAFDAIFAPDFVGLLVIVIESVRTAVRFVQASDDPLTLKGILNPLRQQFPVVPVEVVGPAFLAAP